MNKYLATTLPNWFLRKLDSDGFTIPSKCESIECLYYTCVLTLSPREYASLAKNKIGP